jgi:uncharacterized damage-inducible protein DinB
MRLWLLVPALTLAVAAPSFAQDADPQVKAFKTLFELVKGYVTKSAEKVPDDVYSFQPTPDVRTFGQVVAHIADGNYLLCSKAKGEKSPVELRAIEKSKTTRADIQKALTESYAYCDGAIANLTSATTADKADFFGMEQTKLSMLGFNVAHNYEHYGNLVTYMRIKNIVPPSSEPRPAPTSGSQPSN